MEDNKIFQKVAKENAIFLARVGSRLYGTDTPESDEDFTGIFIPNKRMFYGLQNVKQISLDTNSRSSGKKNTKDDKDIVYYTLQRFCELAIKNNPNIAELFFVNNENILINSGPIWGELSSHYDWFISKKVFNSFMRYATAQEHLMKTKTERYLSVAKTSEYLEKLKNENVKILNEEQVTHLKSLTKNYKNKNNQERDYNKGLTLERVYHNIKEELERYGHRKHNIIKYGYEVKFGSHLVRLLAEGIELAETGKIEFPLKLAPVIKDIKEGKKSLKEALTIIEDLKEKFKKAETKSEIRDCPDVKNIEEFLIKKTDFFLNGV